MTSLGNQYQSYLLYPICLLSDTAGAICQYCDVMERCWPKIDEEAGHLPRKSCSNWTSRPNRTCQATSPCSISIYFFYWESVSIVFALSQWCVTGCSHSSGWYSNSSRNCKITSFNCVFFFSGEKSKSNFYFSCCMAMESSVFLSFFLMILTALLH